MRRKELLQMIEDGENLTCEFKLRFSSHEKIAKEFIAFANTKGGYVIFGVDDDKTIVGVASEKEETELITEVAERYCEPPVTFGIEYINVNNRELVVVKIDESQNKPHRIQDYKNELDITTAQVYVRVQDKSILAGKAMIRVLRQEVNAEGLKKYFIGDLEKRLFTLFEQKEQITVKYFCDEANISYRRASRTLVKLVRAGVLAIFVKDNGEEFFMLRSEVQN